MELNGLLGSSQKTARGTMPSYLNPVYTLMHLFIQNLFDLRN
jgi:hypothetical protein